MKKLSFYMLALLTTAFVGCSEDDYDPSVGPQSNLPESALAVSDVAVATADAPTTVSLADYIDETAGTAEPILVGVATVKEGAMPANTVLKAEVEVSRDADFASSTVLEANAIGDDGRITIDADKLQEAYFSDITKNPATVTLYVRTVLYTLTNGTSLAIVGKPGSNYFDEHQLTFTPLNKVTIAPAYYIVGGPNDWAGSAASRTLKFQHSDEDVYVDPVFTIVFDAAASGDTWFAIGDDAACDAIGAGDWSQLYGIVGGDNEAKEGKLERRSVLGGDNSFKVAEGAKKIRVTINMMEGTFQVEPVSISDAYYLVGGPGSWSSDKSLKFSHSDKDVFDDPVFTYVFEGNGGTGDIWFAFGDAEGLDAIDSDVWNKLYGYVPVNGEMAMSGSFEVRSVLGADNTFHVDGTAKFYRFTINMANKTYEITPLNFQEYIYEAGVNNDWGGYQQPLYCADGNGVYTGFFYAQDADWTGGKGAFKFRGSADDWDHGNYGTGTFDEATLSGTLIDDGGSDNIKPEVGFYRADVNLADMTYQLTAIKSVYVVGGALNDDWNEGVKMTFNTTKHCWECDATFTKADVIKFKGNGTWDTIDGNWGGTMDNIVNGSNDNIPVTLTGDVHIEFYPLCDTKSYCTITQR